MNTLLKLEEQHCFYFVYLINYILHGGGFLHFYYYPLGMFGYLANAKKQVLHL